MMIGKYTIGCLLILTCCHQKPTPEERRPPNILFAIADDQSFPHASAYGMSTFRTPAFDKIARSGVLFRNAFVTAPQCSPSRASLLTGRPIWQLEEAGTHSSYFPKKYPVFTDALAASGYFVGYTGKGWGPGNWKDAGWSRNPVGTEYNQKVFEEVAPAGISKTDYVKNFEAFLNDRAGNAPFFFWFGAHEPHRIYEYGSGRKAGLELSGLTLPGFLPPTDSVKTDMLDYALEIAWFDSQLNKMLDLLDEIGELDNTIVIVTADNGMPFPHAKAALHEYGIHVPLAISGPVVAKPGRIVDDMISLIDLAPTLLELCNVTEVEGMMGKSLVPLLTSGKDGVIDTTRSFILAGRERHTHARPDNVGYPARALRNRQYLYIHNMKPERWPMGDPPPLHQDTNAMDSELKPIVRGYEDIDDSPTKDFMLYHPDEWPALFAVAFGKRDAEELYDLTMDPDCLDNLSDDEGYAAVLETLRRQLVAELTAQGDPRMGPHGDVFDSYPRFGRMRPFEGFKERGEYNPAFVSKKMSK